MARFNITFPKPPPQPSTSGAPMFPPTLNGDYITYGKRLKLHKATPTPTTMTGVNHECPTPKARNEFAAKYPVLYDILLANDARTEKLVQENITLAAKVKLQESRISAQAREMLDLQDQLRQARLAPITPPKQVIRIPTSEFIVPENLKQELLALVRSNQKIAAIKLLRSYPMTSANIFSNVPYEKLPEDCPWRTNFIGLKEAKDYVESL